MRNSSAGGLFGLLMGSQVNESSDRDADAAQVGIDARKEFEIAMAHAARTLYRPEEAEEILSALINSWRCIQVEHAR